MALIEHFHDEAEILIATEAGAEGINLQFCSLIINYDLPWNPQRIEQRIGRCHRYGQKFDVVVINFLNKRNQADKRVLELLTEKFNLFDGVFGASDEVLGRVENKINIVKAIETIYATCRTPNEIDEAFKNLQTELEEAIKEKRKSAEKAVIENFDEDIHDLLKIKLEKAETRLDRMGRYFWRLTKFMLATQLSFTKPRIDDVNYAFALCDGPNVRIYQLIGKGNTKPIKNAIRYRLTHPLGEKILEGAKLLPTKPAEITFQYSGHETKISAIEQLSGCSGWLILKNLKVISPQLQEHLIFTGLNDDGTILDEEVCEKLFSCEAKNYPQPITYNVPEILHQNAQIRINAKINSLAEENNLFFLKEEEKIDKWAKDKEKSAEQALDDTKKRLADLDSKKRKAQSLDEQKAIQLKIREEEASQARQRQRLFATIDEIREKRNALIDRLNDRMKQQTDTDDLFVLRWKVV